MKSENGVMEMREVAGELNIPAHGSVGLTPGGYHVMFTHLAHPLAKGDTVKATLNFEHAGPLEVEFKVVWGRSSGDRRHEGRDQGRYEDVTGNPVGPSDVAAYAMRAPNGHGRA